MTHIAMFDAINTIEREFEPYRVRLRHWGGGSPEAAAAQAAHDVLVVINPAATATYDAALARQLGSKPSGFVRRGAAARCPCRQGDSGVAAERRLGGLAVSSLFRAAAARTLAADAAEQPDAGIHPSSERRADGAADGHAVPAATAAIADQRALRRRPERGEAHRQIGQRRPARAEQTAIARLWAGIATTGVGTATNFLSIWNNIARDVARERRLSLVETARVFVLVNVSVHDGLQTTQTSKFVYGLWRPVTAIRQADTDLNPATDPDPAWLPLLTTPPYPSYAGNMATIGASAARALQLAFGTNDMPVTATWRQSGGLPDVSHQFDGFWQVAEEQSVSRIYGGIHYRFDQDAGQQIGRSAAEFVFANFMTPRSRWDD